MIRTAIVQLSGSTTAETIKRYLPSNYQVTDQTPETVTISGEDNAGWTLDDYVIPRLASGMIFAKEIRTPQVPEFVVVDTRDGYVFWRDRTGEFFTQDTAQAFIDNDRPGCVLRKLAKV